MDKEHIRSRLRQARQRISAGDREKANAVITRQLLARPEVTRAQTICCYVSTGDEVDTREIIVSLLTQGKHVVVPKVAGKNLELCRISSLTDLTTGSFGILEPKETCQRVRVSKIDVFIIPGIVFDRDGHRLGWGKGYYDRLLAHLVIPKIGLAYQIQIVPRLPHDAYDIQMNTVITEQEVYGQKE